MIFRKSAHKEGSERILLSGETFEVVSQYKYLGHIIQYNLYDINDAEYRLNNFYGKFHWILRNFKSTSLEVLLFLFNYYCSPDYGLPLWSMKAIASKQIFKTFEVAYNGAYKKMVGTSMATSSHAVANACESLLFNHYTVFIQMRYFKKKIIHPDNNVIRLLNFHIKEGYIFRDLVTIFTEKYECNFIDNSLDILKARVNWVQRHEPQTGRDLDRALFR